MIKRKAAMNRDQFLAKMHEYLTDSKATLLRETKAQLQTERDASRDDCMDSADLAAEQSEREISTMLSERKCCNFENGDGGRPERSWAARFQAARSNSLSMN